MHNAGGLHFREPDAVEGKILECLIEHDFPGRDQVARQLAGCRVTTIDEEGSFALQVKGDAQPVESKYRIPVELCGSDADGTPIHALLHVVHGVCKEVEIYRDHPGAVQRIPLEWDRFIPGSFD